MSAQASSQPASHTVYTVHPSTDESAPGNSSREGQTESDLPADSEGWEDGSVSADRGEEAATGPQQPADPEGWDDDFSLGNVEAAQVGSSTALFCVMLLNQGLEQSLHLRKMGTQAGGCTALCSL